MVVLYRIVRILAWIVYAIAVAAMIFLAFGFVLVMFNANKSNDFFKFIADFGTAFMGPFVNLIRPTPMSNGGFISWSALVAIAAYAVLAWLASVVASRMSIAADRTLAEQRREAAAAATAATQAPVAPAATQAAAPTPAPTAPPQAAPPAPAPEAWPAAQEPAAPAAPAQPQAPAPGPQPPVEPPARTQPQPPAAPPAGPTTPQG